MYFYRVIVITGFLERYRKDTEPFIPCFHVLTSLLLSGIYPFVHDIHCSLQLYVIKI